MGQFSNSMISTCHEKFQDIFRELGVYKLTIWINKVQTITIVEQ
jgi:hypothetical protein